MQTDMVAIVAEDSGSNMPEETVGPNQFQSAVLIKRHRDSVNSVNWHSRKIVTQRLEILRKA